MKIQAKIILLLLVIVSIFIASLSGVWLYEQSKYKRIVSSREGERNRQFDEFRARWGESLKTFVDNYSSMDGLAQAVLAGDRHWPASAFREATLDSYKVSAVWVFNPRSVFFYFGGSTGIDPASVTFPQADSERLTRGGDSFFARVPQGILELQASKDTSRGAASSQPDAGLLLAGRLWSESTLREMSRFSGDEVSIIAADDPRLSGRGEKSGVVSFSRPLPGWDGHPVASLYIRNDLPGLRDVHRLMHALIVAAIVFACVIFLALSICLTKWVGRPLRQLSAAIESKSPTALTAMQSERSEVGRLALAISSQSDENSRMARELGGLRKERVAAQQADDEIRRAWEGEAVRNVAGEIANELLHPLTAILGYAEVLQQRLGYDSTARLGAGRIHDAGEQVARLIERLRGYSQTQVTQPRGVDLSSLIASLEPQLRNIAGERLLLEVHPGKGICAHCDPDQLQVAVLTLVANRCSATPDGGKVEVSVKSSPADASALPSGAGAPSCAVLEVSDTAPALDAQSRDTVFRPWLAPQPGFDLAMARGIAAQAQGSLLVEPVPGGNRFEFSLPIAAVPVGPPVTPPEAGEFSPREETILIVESDAVILDLIHGILADQEYRAYAARDLAQASGILEKVGTPRMLIMEVTGADDAAFLRKLRASDPGLAVLLIAGRAEDALKDSGLVEHLLRLPFSPPELASKVRVLLAARPRAAEA